MSNPSFISSLLSTAKKASHGCPGHWSHLIEEFNWINCWVKIHHKAVRYKENCWMDFWHLYFYLIDTEPVYHSFMFPLLSGLWYNRWPYPIGCICILQYIIFVVGFPKVGMWWGLVMQLVYQGWISLNILK